MSSFTIKTKLEGETKKKSNDKRLITGLPLVTTLVKKLQNERRHNRALLLSHPISIKREQDFGHVNPYVETRSDRNDRKRGGMKSI